MNDYDKMYEEYDVLFKNVEDRMDILEKEIKRIGRNTGKADPIRKRLTDMNIILGELAKKMKSIRKYTTKYKVDKMENFRYHDRLKYKINVKGV